MPKKTVVKPAHKTKEQMTKRELSRWEREQRQERVALLFVIGTIVAVLGILFAGLWREILSRPMQVVARVGNESITLGALRDNVTYQAKTLDTQIAMYQTQIQQMQAQAGSDETASFLVQYYQQQLQQMQQQRYSLGDGSTVLEDLIDQALIKQEAQKRGASVSAADIDLAIQSQFQPQPDATPAPDVTGTTSITGTTGITETAPTQTPAPTATAIPADAWKTNFQNTLKSYSITEAQFRQYTMEPYLWRTKLQEIVGSNVVTTAEQIHAFHIVLPNITEARDAFALLQQSAITFEDEAKAVSTDTLTKDKGGDLGWVARGEQGAEFDAVAFALPLNQVSEPVTTTAGAVLIKVTEKDANRALSETQLGTAKSEAYNNWLTEAQQRKDITRSLDSDKQTWLSKQIPASKY